jgi:hypothetical protein
MTNGLSLSTMADAMAFAEMVAKTEFAPKDFRGKPEACLMAIQHGSEIGLSKMQSLQSIAVVNGRPTIYGDAALAVCQSSAVCEWITESVDGDGDKMIATCSAQRRGYPAPIVSTFSVADAKAAGLWGKSGPWSQYPKRMLAMRARGFALRNAFADVLRGLVTSEEAGDYQQIDTVAIDRTNVKAKVVEVAYIGPRLEAKPASDVFAKAAGAIERAKTVDRCESLRAMLDERKASGLLTSFEFDDLVGQLHQRIGTLIDAGQEVIA